MLLDRLFEENKAKNVGRLYLSYLDKVITWREFQSITSLLDRIIPQDIEILQELRDLNKDFFTKESTNSSLQRLIGAGIVANISFGFSLNENSKLYFSSEKIQNELIECKLTDIGQLMIKGIFR